jgi:hypothetical protein
LFNGHAATCPLCDACLDERINALKLGAALARSDKERDALLDGWTLSAPIE